MENVYTSGKYDVTAINQAIKSTAYIFVIHHCMNVTATLQI